MRKYYFVLLVTLLASMGCDEILYHGLSEQQANEILVALADRGIDAQKLQDGSLWNVVTEKEQLGNALLVLRRYRLPRLELVSEGEATSFLSGREEREYRRERQISRNLENTLMALPEIVEARVHLALSTRTPLGIDPVTRVASASVLLVHQTGAVVDLNAVKSIVSGASGVASSQIAVVDKDADDGRATHVLEESPSTTPSASSPESDLPSDDLTFSFPSRQDSKFALTALAIGCFVASAFGVVLIARRIRRRGLQQNPETNLAPPPLKEVESVGRESLFGEVFVENGRIVRREELLQ